MGFTSSSGVNEQGESLGGVTGQPESFMSHLLQPLKRPHLLRWACFERHRALINALSLSKQRPPCSSKLLSGFVTMFMNHPG
jgi:hypothetical protein